MFNSSSPFKSWKAFSHQVSHVLVRRLDSHDSFSTLNDEQLIEMSSCNETLSEESDSSKKIPLSFHQSELKLNHVDLSLYSFDEVIDELSNLPDNIDKIDLNHALNFLTAEKIERVMESLPFGIISLNLSDNDLHRFSIEELNKILKAIPCSVLSLNMSNNSLYKIPNAQLFLMFSNFPIRLQHLNLSSNNIGQIENIEDFTRALKRLSPTVKSINFDNNMLGLTCKNDNKKILSALPNGTKSISLRDNIYQNWKDKDFTQILLQLPRSIETVEINHNYMGVMQSNPRKKPSLKELLKISRSFELVIAHDGLEKRYDINRIRHETYHQSRDAIHSFLGKKLPRDCRNKLMVLLNIVDEMKQQGYDIGELAIVLSDTLDFMQENISFNAYMNRCRTYQGSTDKVFRRVGDAMMILGTAIFAAGLVLTAVPTVSVILSVGTGVGGLTLTLGSYGLFKNIGLAKASEDFAKVYDKILKV